MIALSKLISEGLERIESICATSILFKIIRDGSYGYQVLEHICLVQEEDDWYTLNNLQSSQRFKESDLLLHHILRFGSQRTMHQLNAYISLTIDAEIGWSWQYADRGTTKIIASALSKRLNQSSGRYCFSLAPRSSQEIPSISTD